MRLLIVFSAILSLVLFVIFSFMSGRIANSGYDWGDLDRIARTALDAIGQRQPFKTRHVLNVLEHVHRQYPNVQLEWIDADGKAIYDTSGRTVTYRFADLADRMQSQYMLGNSKALVFSDYRFIRMTCRRLPAVPTFTNPHASNLGTNPMNR